MNDSRLAALTERQRFVLGHIAQGCSAKEIAARLGITENGAKKHLENLRRRYGVSNRVELLVAAIRAGDVELERIASALPLATVRMASVDGLDA